MTQIDSEDAIKNIKRFDRKTTFFYIDPPYYNSRCGPYKGYTIDDFKILLETLIDIKGKFLLSSYPSEILNEYIEKGNWNSKEYIKNKYSNAGKNNKREVLTANYLLEEKQNEKVSMPFTWMSRAA
jgi:DNA adenine methylase